MTKPAATPALPGLLGEIEQVVGLQAALLVASVAGGRKKYIPLPANLADDHWLVKAIGMAHARRVAEHLTAGQGGMHYTFPWGPAGSRAKRMAALRAALAAGESTNQVAGAFGMHERTIRRHRSGEIGKVRITDKRQIRLFDGD